MIKELFIILLASSLINNIVLSYFLGLCPLIGTSEKMKSAVRMGTTVIIVITLASIVNGMIYEYVLKPLGIEFLQTIIFILIIIAIVKLLEVTLKRFSGKSYNSIGIYLPVIITNCVVLGAVLINVRKDYGLINNIFNGFAISIGFALVLIILAGIREKIKYNNIPDSFKGLPILLMIAGLMSMAFLGFSL